MRTREANLPIHSLDYALDIPHRLSDTNQFSLQPHLGPRRYRPYTRHGQRPRDGPVLHEPTLRIHVEHD